MNQTQIRNFCIIAHINHGKSTLADRMLEATNTVSSHQMKDQILDSNPIERERGITIKLAPVRMDCSLNSARYILNLIDTPGHVDFSYEVSRSLAACEGAILVVDAVKGIQAQTLANFSLAKKQGLKIIPVVNKIDLAAAEPEKVGSELTSELGFEDEEIIYISAKTGENVDLVFEAIVGKVPAPSGKADSPFRALVFNSHYDPYKGVVVWIRVVDGQIRGDSSKKQEITLKATKASSEILEMGYFLPEMKSRPSLVAGEVGYLATGLKQASLSFVGDTVVIAGEKKSFPLPGYKKAKPMVFAGLYPVDNDDFSLLSDSLQKLRLSDSALSFSPELSQGLGKGFRCGFLGLLHAEIVRERLEREFGVSLVITSPTVNYKITKKNGEILKVTKATDFPDPGQIDKIYEPIVELTIFTPVDYIDPLITLCKLKRGELIGQTYFGTQVKLRFKMPLAEMVVDFYDLVKNFSSGYASLDWEPKGLAEIDAVRLDILLNGQRVDAFSQIVARKNSQNEGKKLVKKLKKLIPRQLFEIVIQAAVGSKIIARETIPPFRKDVTAKLYGGDRTRKMKLLEKQKEGKKRMKQIGKAGVPQEVFLEIFKR